MKTFFLAALLLLGNCFCSYSQSALSEKITFATVDEAQKLLSQEDFYTASWSAFDIDSRLGKVGGTKAELFAFIQEQVLAWTAEEEKQISLLISGIESSINELGLKIVFPEQIPLIKTSLKEEGGAVAYTRSSYIVFSKDVTSMKESDLEALIVHELFHVLSRNNPDLRAKLYALIGFKITNSIPYPESIAQLRITNPDAPQTDSYISLEVDGAQKDCMMVLYADKAYSGSGSFFEYLKIGFLQLEGSDEKQVSLTDGKPSIYSFAEVGGFFEQVGKNTEYIIHPEEIMAENFSYAVLGKTGLPDQKIVDQNHCFTKRVSCK